MFDFLRPHESLLSWAVFGLVLIGLTISVSNAFLDTTVWQLEAQRHLSGSIEKPRPAPDAPAISNWKTYRNEQYGFEVRYPVGFFSAQTGSTTLQFFSGNREYFGVEIGHFIPVVQCFDDGLREYCPPGFSDAVVSFYPVDGKFANVLRVVRSQWGSDNVIATSVAGLEGFFVEDFLEYAAQSTYFIPFPDQQKTMVIVREYLGAIPVLQDKGILSAGESFLGDILSTFRFIEPIDTSTWETYRNEQYGFGLSYPANWKLTEYSSGTSIILDPPNNPGIAKTYFGLSIENKTLGTIREAMPPEVAREEIVVAGRASDKYIYDPSRVSIYVPFDDRVGVYHIDLYTPPGVDEPNQILSTFKFIEPIDTSTWKTYRSEAYGFEITYPSGWVILENSDPFLVFLFSVDRTRYIHGLGIPPFGEMEIVVGNICSRPSDGFVPLGPYGPPGSSGSYSLEKTVCSGTFQIRMGFTNDSSNPLSDEQVRVRENTLEAIAASFRTLE